MGNRASAAGVDDCSPAEVVNYCSLPDGELSDPSTRIRVAVIGRSGAGKSSLINALCDRAPSDPDAAPQGVTECTVGVKPYAVRWCSHIKVYDTPGFGTPSVPWEAYRDGLCLDQYDAAIIVNNSRFVEEDGYLITKMKEMDKKYFFVRTKIDEELEAHRQDHPDTHQPDEVLSTIAVNYIPQIEMAGDDDPTVFLISSRRGVNRAQLDSLKVFLSNLQPRPAASFP